MTKEIHFLSFNTHLFVDSFAASFSPDLIYKDEERLEGIRRRVQVTSPPLDIVGLTEVWAHSTLKTLDEAFAQPFSSFAFQGEPAYAGGAGMLLSVRGRFTRPVSFQPYLGMVEADRLSTKGVAYGRAEVQGVEVFIIQTHTQASYVGKEDVCREARRRQLADTLFPIIDENDDFPGPVFLLGDLNIVGGSDEYNWFARQLKGRGLVDAWASLPGHGPGYTYCPIENPLVQHFDQRETQPQRLDYIFHRPAKSALKSMSIPTDWKAEDGTDLSDHYPVLATFVV